MFCSNSKPTSAHDRAALKRSHRSYGVTPGEPMALRARTTEAKTRPPRYSRGRSPHNPGFQTVVLPACIASLRCLACIAPRRHVLLAHAPARRSGSAPRTGPCSPATAGCASTAGSPCGPWPAPATRHVSSRRARRAGFDNVCVAIERAVPVEGVALPERERCQARACSCSRPRRRPSHLRGRS